MKSKWLNTFSLLIATTFIIAACNRGGLETAIPVKQAETSKAVVKEEVVQGLTIPDVYTNQENLLGSQITIEGYYSLDGPSYLLSDYDYAINNKLIPIESILILNNVDLLSNKLSIGDVSAYIRITGKLVRYNNNYPDYIDDNGKFLALEVKDWILIKPSFIKIPEDLTLPQPAGYLQERVRHSGPDCLWVLIISGSPYTFPGTNLAAVNHVRYWNNVLFAYQMSTRLGAQWIRVLYSTGKLPAPFFGRVPGNIPKADLQEATRTNLSGAFKTVGDNMPGNCQLWIITTDHGVGWTPPNMIGLGPGANYIKSGVGRIDGAPSDAIVPEGDRFPGDENLPASIRVGNVVDADLGDDVDEGLVLLRDLIYDDSFAFELFSNVNAVLEAKGNSFQIYIMMAQCYSGGFIAELSGLVTQIATAASENQSSHGMQNLEFSQFLYYFISALNQAGPWGGANPAPNPDLNLDGVVDWSEAYQYALVYRNRLDDPQFQ